MKKILTLFVIFSMVLSCTVENDISTHESVENLSYDFSEDSNLGTYRGVFTTLNSKYRGTVSVHLPNNPTSQQIKYPRAVIQLTDGSVFRVKAREFVEAQVAVDQLLFESPELTFQFSVNANGTLPTITEVRFKDQAADIVVLKETQRAPVTPVTGTYECGDCNGHPVLGTGLEQSFNFVFSTPDGNGTITTQSAIGTTVYNGIGVQNTCVADGNFTTCTIESGDGSTTTTGFLANGNPVTWVATHLFNNEASGPSDCSEVDGTWQWQSISYGLINGTFTSDSSCFSTLVFEDFEDSSVLYTPSVAEFTDGDEDYFLRTDGSDINGGVMYSGISGSSFFGAQDLDGDGEAPEQFISFAAIPVSGISQIKFSALFAEDDDGSNEDWDAPDFVIVEYSFDGTTYNSFFALENDGSTFNSAPFVDTDLDGTGDGAEITDTFTSYSGTFVNDATTNPTSSTTVEIRIRMFLDSGDEDIAIDDVLIEGL